jgi:hypothetical protein
VTDLHARDARRYPVSVLWGLLGVSKQAYYKRDENAELAKAAQEEFALQYIREVRAKDSGIGGTCTAASSARCTRWVATASRT